MIITLDYITDKINNYMRSPINKPNDKTSDKTSSNNTPPDSSELVEIDLKEIMKKLMNNKAVKEEVTKEAMRRIDTQQSVDAIKNILSEYFNAYILIGYGIDGRRTILRSANSDQDDDSLFELIRYTFMRVMQQGS